MYWKMPVKFRCCFPSRGIMVKNRGFIWSVRGIAVNFAEKPCWLTRFSVSNPEIHDIIGENPYKRQWNL